MSVIDSMRAVALSRHSGRCVGERRLRHLESVEGDDFDFARAVDAEQGGFGVGAGAAHDRDERVPGLGMNSKIGDLDLFGIGAEDRRDLRVDAGDVLRSRRAAGTLRPEVDGEDSRRLAVGGKQTPSGANANGPIDCSAVAAGAVCGSAVAAVRVAVTATARVAAARVKPHVFSDIRRIQPPLVESRDLSIRAYYDVGSGGVSFAARGWRLAVSYCSIDRLCNSQQRTASRESREDVSKLP